MKLSEFVDSDGAISFYQSTLDLSSAWVDQVKSSYGGNFRDIKQDTLNDAEEIKDVALAFRKSLEDGIKEFSTCDAYIRDSIVDHWVTDGLNTNIVLEPYFRQKEERSKQIAAKRPKEIILPLGKLDIWMDEVKKYYPAAEFRDSSISSGDISAIFDNKVVGNFGFTNKKMKAGIGQILSTIPN